MNGWVLFKVTICSVKTTGIGIGLPQNYHSSQDLEKLVGHPLDRGGIFPNKYFYRMVGAWFPKTLEAMERWLSAKALKAGDEKRD